MAGSFLGVGWKFPPRFVHDGSQLQTVEGQENVHQSLRVLFATEFGERRMRDSYGSDLRSLAFEERDRTLLNRIDSHIREAVRASEPRVQVLSTTVDASPDDERVVLIRVSYMVQNTNSRFNLVFPFFLDESQPD